MTTSKHDSASSQALQRMRNPPPDITNPWTNLLECARYAWVTYGNPEIREAMNHVREAVHESKTVLDNKLEELRSDLENRRIMNEYVKDLENRAPALFRGGTAEYTGVYQGRVTSSVMNYTGWGMRTIEESPALVHYVVSNEESAGKTQAEVSVPIHDVADFEDALKERITQGEPRN